MTIKYDLLTYLALGTFLIVIALGAFVLVMTPDTRDLETRKVRFAAATFTGILTLFVFAAVLYFVDSNPQGPGKEIFDKAVTAMTPLIGAIIGYLFGTHRSRARDVCTGEKQKIVQIRLDRRRLAPPLSSMRRFRRSSPRSNSASASAQMWG